MIVRDGDLDSIPKENLMNTKVYVLSPDDPYQMEVFKRFAPEDADIIWVDNRQSIEEQAAQLREARAIVITPSEFSVDLALKCPHLKLLQTVSAGTNMLDIKALEEIGIQVANNGGGNAVAVAEHTVVLMVSVYRKLD